MWGRLPPTGHKCFAYVHILLADLIKLIIFNIISSCRWFYDEAACAVGMATLPMLILLMLVLVRTEFFDKKKLNLVLVTRWLLAAADWLMCFF